MISQALYCIKIGCTATEAGASFIAGGAAYDSLLEQSGWNPVFVPFMAKLITVFVVKDLTKINTFIANNVSSDTASTQKTDSVTEVLKKYHEMSPKIKQSL